MWEFVKGKYVYARDSFHGSHVIVWSRFNGMFGAAWLAISQTDMSVFISDHKQLAYWAMANSFITESLRQYKEQWHDDGDKK